uniref:Uncharacterized protein n=1 Tax=Chromera velia CCMP2878 TaxID=1169474 RepID=A0A0G4I9C5_9ALVE|eukprot:Cvel_12224.t1-p1 / transcript=Cvel_12224.t1 / gene=Cvel_12224 / organism=Chromera_velia_CCMP2878 / gene_product=hypothetical protein / transcript_product=hypothetical protein / location=Cvel_scaffold791:40189-43525(-) / protein_length=481 / sequence_SO=supercontig / SO=protein_coding / is_pseudo=false
MNGFRPTVVETVPQSSVLLQSLLFYDVLYKIPLFVIVIATAIWKYEVLPRDDYFATRGWRPSAVAIALLLAALEPLRLWIGYVGNLQEQVPQLFLYLMCSFFPSGAAVILLLLLPKFNILDVERAAYCIQLFFYVTEALVGYRAVRLLIGSKTAKFFLARQIHHREGEVKSLGGDHPSFSFEGGGPDGGGAGGFFSFHQPRPFVGGEAAILANRHLVNETFDRIPPQLEDDSPELEFDYEELLPEPRGGRAQMRQTGMQNRTFSSGWGGGTSRRAWNGGGGYGDEDEDADVWEEEAALQRRKLAVWSGQGDGFSPPSRSYYDRRSARDMERSRGEKSQRSTKWGGRDSHHPHGTSFRPGSRKGRRKDDGSEREREKDRYSASSRGRRQHGNGRGAPESSRLSPNVNPQHGRRLSTMNVDWRGAADAHARRASFGMPTTPDPPPEGDLHEFEEGRTPRPGMGYMFSGTGGLYRRTRTDEAYA